MGIENSYDPDERRIEAMMDGSGFSRETAEIKLGKKIVSGTSDLPGFATPPRQERRRGNVRDFESDRDHQLAAERAAYEPLSPEQADINARGRAGVETALDEAFGKDRHIQAIIEDVNRLIPIDPDDVPKSEAARERMVNARLRTYFERRNQS